MIIVFWIALGVIIAIIVYLTVLILQLKLKPRWGHVPTDSLAKEEISIDTPSGTYRGFVYRCPDVKDWDPMLGVIILPRRDLKYPSFEHWGAHFALQGFTTLCVETFDKKSSYNDYVTKLAKAIPSFIDKLGSLPSVLDDKVVIFGEEDSAEAAVLSAKDSRVRLACASSMQALSKDRLNDLNALKGKVLLAHCADDEVAPVEGFHDNVDVLGLPRDNYLLLELGGHHLLSQEVIVSGFFSIRIHQLLKPSYPQIEPKEISFGLNKTENDNKVAP